MQDFIQEALGVVDSLFEQHNHDPDKTVEATLEYFRKRLDSSSNDLFKVPSLNHSPPSDFKPGQLVRFRCMIQDMYDPEYFIPTFSKGSTLCTSLFRDRFDNDSDQDPMDSRPMDRSTWHCIAVPAENAWVTAGHKSLCNKWSLNSDKVSDGDEERMEIEQKAEPLQEDGISPEKKMKVTDDTEQIRTHCFPLARTSSPDHQTTSCIVKVYAEPSAIRVNDVIEVVGVLSTFPDLSKERQAENGDFGSDEFCFKNPPSSVVPRIHAVFHTRISHQNPLLGYHIEEESAILRRRILEEALTWRTELLSLLKQILLGDEHSAEYVLLHIISRVYIRHDVLPLGKFSLNLRNANSEMAKLLAELFSELVTKSHLVEMSLDFLNGTKFIPSKDYDLNRLQSGLLQLSDGTHLLCDENALDAGKLTATGVDNVKALGNMIQNQSVQYNFGFHQMEFLSDVPVLYLSQGKGLIRCDFQIKLKPVDPLGKLTSEEFKATLRDRYANEELMTNLRRYITVVKLSDQKLNEEMQQKVQEDFVAMRNANSTMTADDLHNLLVVARYVALSRGELEMTSETWNHAKELEIERLRRTS